MDLATHLVELIGVPLGAEVDGARLIGVSTELGLRYTFEAAGRTLWVEVALADGKSPFAAREGQLCWSYRTDGDAVDPALGLRLCQSLATRSKTRQQAVLDAIAREAPRDSTRIREIRGGRLLELAGPSHQRYLTVSPYVGCLIGCRFCYAQDRLADRRRLEGLPQVAWGSWVDVRVDAPALLAAELATAPALPIKFCPIVSDPYQAVESRYRLVRACLEVLREHPRPVLLLTRSNEIVHDIDILRTLPQVWAGLSIPTFDDDVRRHFEPRGAAIADRFAALSSLRAAHIRTFAMVQPMLPGPIEPLADALAETCESVRIDVLHQTYGAADDFARYADSATNTWQLGHSAALAEALGVRQIAIWPGELPAELC
jgi:DNA repair photolyase